MKEYFEVPFPMVRSSGKYSTDMTNEELRQAIADSRGIPLEKVPHIDIDAEKVRMRAEWEKVKTIMHDFELLLAKDSKTTEDKYEELFDIAKFICVGNDKFSIEVPALPQRFPDFTLLFNNFKIGVEHTRLWSKKLRATFKTAKYYVKKAEEILGSEIGHLSKTVNVYIDYNKTVIGMGSFANRKFTRADRDQIPLIIADFIRSELTGGALAQPDFISSLVITPNKDLRVDIELAESYFTTTELGDQLFEAIKNKEDYAERYRGARTVDALWLLVVVDDINSYSGFDLKQAKLPMITSSNFDRIYLFEKFGGDVIPLFTNRRLNAIIKIR